MAHLLMLICDFKDPESRKPSRPGGGEGFFARWSLIDYAGRTLPLPKLESHSDKYREAGWICIIITGVVCSTSGVKRKMLRSWKRVDMHLRVDERLTLRALPDEHDITRAEVLEDVVYIVELATELVCGSCPPAVDTPEHVPV